MKLRTAKPEDVEALCALGRDTFREKFGHLYPAQDLAVYLEQAYAIESERRCIADALCYYVIAEVNDVPVGFAKSCPCRLPVDTRGEKAFEVARLYVRSQAQNTGLGSRMLERVSDYAISYGYDTLYIGVWENNFDAHRFYRRHGFVEVGEYPFPVGGTVDRELIMRKAL